MNNLYGIRAKSLYAENRGAYRYVVLIPLDKRLQKLTPKKAELDISITSKQGLGGSMPQLFTANKYFIKSLLRELKQALNQPSHTVKIGRYTAFITGFTEIERSTLEIFKLQF